MQTPDRPTSAIPIPTKPKKVIKRKLKLSTFPDDSQLKFAAESLTKESELEQELKEMFSAVDSSQTPACPFNWFQETPTEPWDSLGQEQPAETTQDFVQNENTVTDPWPNRNEKMTTDWLTQWEETTESGRSIALKTRYYNSKIWHGFFVRNALGKESSLWIQPAEKEFLRCEGKELMGMIYTTLKIKLEKIAFSFALTEQEDSQNYHWYRDLSQGQYRRFRLGLHVFNVNKPEETAYIYLSVLSHRQGRLSISKVGYKLHEFENVLFNV